MNAKEARLIAESVNNSTDIITIKKIETVVQAAAEIGKFSIDFYGEISDRVKKHFKDLEYQIDLRDSGPNEQCYVISW